MATASSARRDHDHGGFAQAGAAGAAAANDPMLVADKRMAKSVDPATVVDPQFDRYAERTAPQFFSDLPPIPADRRL